ncbi:MAG TPA: hypothetical protein VF885_11585 [Arthrobacter sp.]
MTKKKIRPARPTYTEGFKKGAVELYYTRRRENPNETHHGATVAVAETMGVTAMTIRNWVTRAELEAAKATAAPEGAESSEAAAKMLVEALKSAKLPGSDEPEPELLADESTSDDPQVVILALRRELAEVKRANVILKNATAYLAVEALKAA